MEDESQGDSLQQHPHHLPHHHHHHIQQNSSHHIQHRHISSSTGEDGAEEEELDPRIQVELEKLNRATEEINRLELELDDARASFRQVLSDSSQRLNGLAKKLGTSVDKARPYYDSRMKLKEAHLESQKAALRFERACSMHEAAKEMVQLAEEGYKRREEDLDPTWQEMLNHATMKVNDAERERMESEDNHQSTTLNFKKREEEVQKLQRDLKRAITKSKPYFEMKAKFNQVMEDHKRNVSRLEEDVASTKALYSEALRNLEAISDDIHRQRLERRQKMQLGIRGAGVGAESPSPPPSWDKGINIDGSAFHNVFNNDDEEILSEKTGRRRWKEQGIVGFDLPLCHQSSVSDDHDLDSLKSDPLNVVVFKTDSHHHHHYHHHQQQHCSSYDNNNFQPPSIIRADPRCARSSSYRQAVDHSCPDDEPANKVSPHSQITSSLPSTSKTQQRREVEAMQSSLSRAQEWVNKSPVPQQRRFIKSKSLIDASSPSPPPVFSSSNIVGNKLPMPSPPPCHPPVTLTSSLTTEAMRVMASNARLQEENNLKQPSPPPLSSDTCGNNSKLSSALSARLSQQQHQNLPNSTTTTKIGDRDSISIQIQPHLQQPMQASPPNHQHHQYHLPKSSPRSVSTPSNQSSPNSGSPSGRSPKLQGLILRIDAAGIVASPSPTSATSSSKPLSSHNQNNHMVITTKMPPLGMNTEQLQQQFPTTSLPSSSSLSPSTSSFTEGISPSLLSNTTSSTTPSPPRPSLIPNTKSTSLSLGGFKLPSAASKTPQSSAFHLPSPTQQRSSSLSIPPPLAIRQMISPTPPSPSGDRVSILSGRSDSTKGGLLRPPSDSSDTESIASTGPMLDDDQVEFLTLDFNEQSISAANQEPVEEGDLNVVDPVGLQRGNWSRMSLPPRLNNLVGGYLERARQVAPPGVVTNCVDSDAGRNNENDDEDFDDLSPQVGDRDIEMEEQQGDIVEAAVVEEENAKEKRSDLNFGGEDKGEIEVSVNVDIDLGVEEEEVVRKGGAIGTIRRDELKKLETNEGVREESRAECEVEATVVMSQGGIEVLENAVVDSTDR